jgi:threonyl-tRNA synthetase
MYKLNGYREVSTPDIWKNWLWMKSGHYDKYHEHMFQIQNTETAAEEKYQEHEKYCQKSMNCPGHYRIYQQSPRHVHDLPFRIAEFGTLHRNELVGALRGLFRVRKFHQDDAHIFCPDDDVVVQNEIGTFLKMLDDFYTLFGFEYTLELSTKPESALHHDLSETGSKWERAESLLKIALDKNGKTWSLNEGDGAFYGPKIDVHLTDSLGRSHQCGTIQLDLQLPERFDAHYFDDQGVKHRPVVLHRAILGSLERFIGILLEHYQGKLPFWLSKNQFMICSLYKKGQDQSAVNQYIIDFQQKLLNKDYRINVDIDTSDTHIKQKVKHASEQGYHYILVVGGKEVEQQTIAIRQGRKVEYNKTPDDVIELFQCERKY